MLAGPELTQILRSLPTVRLSALGWRASRLAYALDPLGLHRPISDGRFNLRRSARVLYLALEAETALAESMAVSGYPPRGVALVPIRIDLRGVLDLRNPAIRNELQLSSSELALNFRFKRPGATGPAPTQFLGETCNDHGVCEALLYPSQAAEGGSCLAVFESCLQQPASLEVDDAEVSALPGLVGSALPPRP